MHNNGKLPPRPQHRDIIDESDYYGTTQHVAYPYLQAAAGLVTYGDAVSYNENRPYMSDATRAYYAAAAAMAGKEAVASPQHYTKGWLETIYTIRQVLGAEGFKAFCLGNWIKYKERHAFKAGEEDLKKAEQYLEWAVRGLPSPLMVNDGHQFGLRHPR